VTQLVNSIGGVEDLSAYENSADPSQRALAQVKVNMDKWARANGFASYDVPQNAPPDVLKKYIDAHLTFYDQAQRSIGQPTRIEQVAQEMLESAGDIIDNGDGTYTLSDAAAADAALGIGRVGAGATGREAAAVNAAAAAILSGATVPATAAAVIASIVRDNPDVSPVLSAPPNAGGSGAAVVSYPADVTQAPSMTAAPAPAATLPAGVSAAAPVTTAADVSAIIGDERRTRALLGWLAAGALLVYLARR
jgi:hypothetical protein